jgi:hypothetical protein
MVRISWTAPEGPVTGFEVSQAGGSGVHELLPADARAYTASSLDPLRWTSFSVRALNENGPGPWASTDAIVPWPSSAWRPVDFAEFGGRLAFVAGDTIFDSGDPLSRVIPLDPSGIPWGEIGPRRNPIDPPYLTDAASASLTISDVAACMYVTGGHLGYSGEALSNVAARCVQDDGFLGSSLPRHGTRAAPPMRIARFDHASVTLGDRLYVLGGAQRDASGAVSSLSDVSSAPIGADFVPGAWQSTTPLPFPAHGVAAAAWSGRIYVVAPTPGRVRILVAQPGVDGPIAEWRETLGFTANREGASTAIASGFLYVLGGNADGEPSVAIGRIDEDTGNVVSWSTDPADSFVGQPKRPAVVLRGNRLYVFGSGITLQVADIDPTTGRPLRWR